MSLNQSCVLHLTLDDNADNYIVTDSSVYKNTCVYTDGEGLLFYTSNRQDADPKRGTGALTFDGTASYIKIPDDSSIQLGTDDCSLSFYLKGTLGDLGTDDRIFYKGLNFQMYLTGSPTDVLLLYFGCGDTRALVSADYLDGVWHHVAILRIAGTLKVFRDYVEDTTDPVVGASENMSYSGADLFFGAQAVAANHSIISLDEIKFCNDGFVAIEKSVYVLLSDDANIIETAGNRIYPMVVPQDASLPAITYQILSTTGISVMAGPTNLKERRLQINCWAETYTVAEELAHKVGRSLDGYRDTAEDVKIWGIELIDEGDVLADHKSAQVLRRYGRRLDFRIHYRELTI